MTVLEKAPLGQKTEYRQTYAPELLYPVPRSLNRDKVGIVEGKLPFGGWDVWNGYELSWLNPKGKPEIATATFRFSCKNPYIVESKSFKLYLNAFNQTSFEGFDEVAEVLKKDLSRVVGGEVEVALFPVGLGMERRHTHLDGVCLDALDIATDVYTVEPAFLTVGEREVEETLYSDLLKSNCLATGQPDWGSLWIRYQGRQIDHAGLLKYIISYRNHSGFAEHCVEQIFVDLMARCAPEKLSVYARYTRRGGLDINPFRSTFEHDLPNTFLIRQ